MSRAKNLFLFVLRINTRYERNNKRTLFIIDIDDDTRYHENKFYFISSNERNAGEERYYISFLSKLK